MIGDDRQSGIQIAFNDLQPAHLQIAKYHGDILTANFQLKWHQVECLIIQIGWFEGIVCLVCQARLQMGC